MVKAINILSIDGGGIRGIIPAMLLAEIEKRTGRSISKLFHLMAGTSTGGVLTLGLSKPDGKGEPQYSAAELVGLYEKNGGKILFRSCWHRVKSLGRWADEKYLVQGMQETFQEYFGASRLKDALTNVLLTAYEIELRCPFFFRSERAKKDPAYDFPMVAVAMATSAAPTYFEPCRIMKEESNDYYALIDGGVYANNPAMCAYAEARWSETDPEDFLLVSIGTGEQKVTLPYDKAKSWGMAQWAKPLMNIIFDGVNDTVDYQLRRLIPPGKDGQCRYYRFQPEIKDEISLDNASPENIRHLKKVGRALISEHHDDLEALCHHLIKHEFVLPKKTMGGSAVVNFISPGGAHE